jgi:5S rRNA maturation endonuclease (ribonuclease M5)
MLFNLVQLECADTVIICEGEQDANTVTDLHLRGRYGEAAGTTSGSASSWRPELAKHLSGRRVIILPDDDEAGKAYADSVEESLKAQNIEYRRVSFEGTGCKDVSEFVAKRTTEELVRLIGVDWVGMPDGTWLTDPLAPSCMVPDVSIDEEIPFLKRRDRKRSVR